MNNNAIIGFRGKFFFLSNFYPVPVKYKGITYQNSEAAFQAQKCMTEEEKLSFENIDPSEAKRLGRRIKMRPDWNKRKFDEMYAIVKAKFEQHPEILQKLLETENAYIQEENTWGDKIWGTVNGAGQNLLGKILMQIREELKNQNT